MNLIEEDAVVLDVTYSFCENPKDDEEGELEVVETRRQNFPLNSSQETIIHSLHDALTEYNFAHKMKAENATAIAEHEKADTIIEEFKGGILDNEGFYPAPKQKEESKDE